MGAYCSWHTRDLWEQSEMPCVGFQQIRIKPKLHRLFLGSPKARASPSPWWALPIIQSCLPPRLSAPSNNPPQVKLSLSCQRTPDAHYFLPGGTSTLFGSPPLTMLYVLVWCLWLLSFASLCLLFLSITFHTYCLHDIPSLVVITPSMFWREHRVPRWRRSGRHRLKHGVRRRRRVDNNKCDNNYQDAKQDPPAEAAPPVFIVFFFPIVIVSRGKLHKDNS